MRLILFLLSFVVLLFLAALIGPSFVDWNKYKPQILDQVKSATGLDVKIGGDLSLAVLPSPRVKVESLSVVAPRKIKFENLLVMKSAEISVAILPLLQKKVDVKTITLIQPDINVEIMSDGTPSWMSDKLQNIQKGANSASALAPQNSKSAVVEQAGNALDSISLERVKVQNGKLSFIDHRKKGEQKVEDINLVLKASSLKGPFDAKGSILYGGNKIVADIQTGRLPKAGEGFQINADISVPETKSHISFDGVSSIKAPFDAQGQLGVKLSSLAKTVDIVGVKLGKGYDQSFSLDGLLSADEDNISYDNLKLSFGQVMSNGKLSIQNFKNKNPLRVSGVLKSSSVLDLDTLLEGAANNPAKKDSSSQELKQSGKLGAKKTGLIPQSLTLPMPIDIGMKIDMAGVKLKGNKLGGVFVDLKKVGKESAIDFKALELPGQGKIDGSLLLKFGSSSFAGQAVTYADPSVSYVVDGQVNHVADFISAFAPKAKVSDINKLYKAADFNLKGHVDNKSISLKDSVLKLDQTVIGLGGNYKPRGGVAGRDRAYIDISAGNINVDMITATLSGKKKSMSNDSETASSPSSKGQSPKDTLKPLQNLSLPLDLGFDVSVQKARVNQMDVEGIRFTGDLAGNALTLKNASANNFAGAAIGLKGKIDDLNALSGLDLDAFLRTSDITKIMSALKMDGAAVPSGVKAANINVEAKGSAQKMAFSTNVKALNGQVDVSGNAQSILDKPVFNNLTIAAKHPNMGSALEAILKGFKAPNSMRRAINLSTKAELNGKSYKLSDLNVVFGKSKFGGNLDVNTTGEIPVVRGRIQAGKIALDELLGVQSSSGGKSRKSSKGNNKTTAQATKQRWSKTPINLDWMNKIDLDVDLAANNITYGNWNLEQPTTDLKIGNGKLSINKMKARVFDGSMTLQTNVNASPVSLILKSQMDNINLERLANALSGSGKLKSAGRVSLVMDVNGTGGSAHALINALNGGANLNGANVILKGFDLAKMARGLAVEEKLADSVTSLVDGATKGGETKFDTLKGDYKIEKGKVNIVSMFMEGDAALIQSTGYADLPQWFINTDHEITLKQVSDLKPFVVKIKGSLDNPSDTFGKNILEDYLSEKIRRKIGKELPGLLGDDVTDKLQKFGIIPKEQAPSPAPANNGAAPAQNQQQQAPAQKQPSANPLDQILQDPKGAEDALKGVLDGLF